VSENRRPGSTRGAATLLLVAVLGIAVVVAAGGLAISRIAVARVRVSSAADLAALAAAPDRDCAKARSVARANRAHLLACEVRGSDVEVTVGLEVAVAGRSLELIAASRAGPP